MVASLVPIIGDLARNPGMCLDWEWNQRPFASQSGAQSTEQHHPGLENFPNFMRDKVIKVQEAHTVSIKRNQNRPTPRHIIIKMAKFKDKETILKAGGEK